MSDFLTNGIADALKPYMAPASKNNVVPFKLPDWVFNSKPAPVYARLAPRPSLSEGLETNIEEIRSAVLAIPPSAISTEPEWMRLARGLAHEAVIYKHQSEQLWEILDTASRRAPGYDGADNRSRFERYIGEALNHENPITIATIFDLGASCVLSCRASWPRHPMSCRHAWCG